MRIEIQSEPRQIGRRIKPPKSQINPRHWNCDAMHNYVAHPTCDLSGSSTQRGSFRAAGDVF